MSSKPTSEEMSLSSILAAGPAFCTLVSTGAANEGEGHSSVGTAGCFWHQ